MTFPGLPSRPTGINVVHSRRDSSSPGIVSSALVEGGGGLSVNGAHIRISLTGGGTFWGSLV